MASDPPATDDLAALRASLRTHFRNARPVPAHEGVVGGVDIGGTRHTVAVADLRGELRGLERRELRPGGTASDIVASVLELLDRLCGPHDAGAGRLLRVGVGFGGPVDPERGTVLRSHHVAGWNGFPLARTLQDRLGAPVVVDNDANAAALGEALLGAGRDFRHVLYLNVGTGIGGGIVVDRRIYQGAHGLAGEIGHLRVLPGGPPCPCGRRGCLEALASGPSIARRAQEVARRDTAYAAALLALAAADPARLTARHVFEAAAAGDPLAAQLVRETAGYLATAIAGAVHLLDPEVVILGGGVADAGELLFAPLRQALSESLLPSIPRIPVLPAAFGYNAGAVGALALALQAA